MVEFQGRDYLAQVPASANDLNTIVAASEISTLRDAAKMTTNQTAEWAQAFATEAKPRRAARQDALLDEFGGDVPFCYTCEPITMGMARALFECK